MIDRGRIVIIGGAVVAVLLQLILAPNIVVFSAMPNFILAFVLVAAMIRPTDSILVTAFVLGLLFDLLGYGPVGSMALLLTVSAFFITRVFRVIDLGNLFMPVIVFVITALAIELVYTFILLALGLAPGFIDSLIYRTLPSILLDCIVGLIVYPFLSRLISDRPQRQSEAPQQELKRFSRKSRHIR